MPLKYICFARSDTNSKLATLRFSADGRFLAAADIRGHVRLFDATIGRELQRVEDPSLGPDVVIEWLDHCSFVCASSACHLSTYSVEYLDILV